MFLRYEYAEYAQVLELNSIICLLFGVNIFPEQQSKNLYRHRFLLNAIYTVNL